MSLSLNFTRSQNRRDASNFYLLLISILLLLSIHANAAAKSVECSVPKEFKLAPPKVEGYPVKISVGLYLLDIVEIDEIRQSFTVDYTADVRWHDPRLSTKSLGYSLAGCLLTVDGIWDPKLHAINPRDFSRIFIREVSVNDEGVVDYYLRLQTVYSSSFDLKQFPFDQQTLQMHLASFQYGPEDVVFQVDEKHTGRLGSLSIPGWVFLSSVSDISKPAQTLRG